MTLRCDAAASSRALIDIEAMRGFGGAQVHAPRTKGSAAPFQIASDPASRGSQGAALRDLSVRPNAMRTKHARGSHASRWLGRLTSAEIQ
jgi:hypothetical protein